MSVGVKICGLTSREAAEAVVKAGADFGGLTFFAASPRHLRIDHAREIAAVLRGRVRIVALMVCPTDSEVRDVVSSVAPDFIQLHGKEDPQRVAEIGQIAKRPIIKALAVAESADIGQANAYREVADYFLFDAKADMSATRPGGLGVAFDWQLLSGRSIARPWGLAGGLTPENVARAIRIANPDFVDASSGVEDSPGQKSAAKIAAFVTAVRNAHYTDERAAAL